MQGVKLGTLLWILYVSNTESRNAALTQFSI